MQAHNCIKRKDYPAERVPLAALSSSSGWVAYPKVELIYVCHQILAAECATDTNSGHSRSNSSNKLTRPPNPRFCLGHSEVQDSCLYNILRLKFSETTFKPSFKKFSSRHLLTKLFQLERSGRGRGLF